MNRRKSREYIKALEAQLAQQGITVLQKYGWYKEVSSPDSVIFYDGERLFRMNLDGTLNQLGNGVNSKIELGALHRLDFNEVRLFLQEVIEKHLGYKIGDKIRVEGSNLGRTILYKKYATSPVSVVGNLVTYYDVPLFNIDKREWVPKVKPLEKPKVGQYVLANLKNGGGVAVFYVTRHIEDFWSMILQEDTETYKILEGDDPVIVMLRSQLNS